MSSVLKVTLKSLVGWPRQSRAGTQRSKCETRNRRAGQPITGKEHGTFSAVLVASKSDDLWHRRRQLTLDLQEG